MREEAHIRQWIKIQDPKTSPAEIKSTTDTPAVMFVGELAEIYPNAVIICQTRDPESWFKSASDLYKLTNFLFLDIIFFPLPTLRYFAQWRESISARLEKIYGMPRQEMGGPGLITIHDNYVRRVVPKDRLFFYNVKEGWEPLCKILNCPIPDQPFPRANDKDSMEKFFVGIMTKAMIRWVQIFAVNGVAVAAGWWAWKQQ